MTAPAPDLARAFARLFDAERAVRRAHGELAAAPQNLLLPALEAGVKEASSLDDEGERGLRLSRIAAVLGELRGPRPVDMLIDILGREEPEARHAAGEALEDVAYERFKEVALGV